MNAYVLFKMMLEFEGLIALITLELTQQSGLIVTDHVTLQAVHIGEGFVANLAALKEGRKKKDQQWISTGGCCG